MNEPEWVAFEEVLRLHDIIISETGGSHGLRDRQLLNSALSRPLNSFIYENASLYEMAAIYAEAIIRNHPFIDGNKRTELSTAYYFLEINGFYTHQDSEASDLMVDLAEKKISRAKVAAFFEKHSDKTQE